jgi:predicted enzyme related to lactoylglutathione lyase
MSPSDVGTGATCEEMEPTPGRLCLPRGRTPKIRAVTTTRIGTAFVPVTDLHASVEWYEQHLGLTCSSRSQHAMVLQAPAGGTITLMAPNSGIAAAPGLDWATCNFVVTDIDQAHGAATAAGPQPSPIFGSPAECRFFTVRDPDGNLILRVDRQRPGASDFRSSPRCVRCRSVLRTFRGFSGPGPARGPALGRVSG